MHRCAFPCLLINHDRGWGPLMCFVLAFHLISKLHTWLLGHHALKYAIDGPRVAGHAPLSPLHDRENGHAYIALNFLAMHCLPSAAVKNRFCRNIWPAGHLYCRPAIHYLPMDLKMVNNHPDMAGENSTWSVMLPSVQRVHLGSCTIFGGARQCKQRQQLHDTDFWARRVKHASSTHFEAGAEATLILCLNC